MKKVSIVGVEGSGKTVLMAAMGDKYKTPDANGRFLKPANRETFAYYTKEVAKLRKGVWPLASVGEKPIDLEWELAQTGSATSHPRSLCNLAFLDYGGEVYRLAFGGGRLTERHEIFKDAITSLNVFVSEADVLIVLVNLSDIINGDREDNRTIETLWLSQNILRFALDDCGGMQVAVAFTQCNAYTETLEACGGLEGAFARYLPEAFAAYSSRVSLFAVSAVDKTVPDPEDPGHSVPAPDFSPKGVDALVGWIASVVAETAKPADGDRGVETKRSFPQRVWRFFSMAFCLGFWLVAALSGYGFGFANFADLYWLRTDDGRACKTAYDTFKALDRRNYNEYMQLVSSPPVENMPPKLQEMAKREGFGTKSLEWRAGFYDRYIERRLHSPYIPSHWLPFNLHPHFKCQLVGTEVRVFRPEGCPAILAVGKVDEDFRVVGHDLSEESAKRRAAK